jgi:hypothetical protein
MACLPTFSSGLILTAFIVPLCPLPTAKVKPERQEGGGGGEGESR